MPVRMKANGNFSDEGVERFIQSEWIGFIQSEWIAWWARVTLLTWESSL